MYVIVTYMNKLKIAYFAGLFDGEGSISIVHQRSPRKDNPEHRIHRLYAGIAMTDKSAIQEFYKAFNKSGCFDERPTNSKNAKTLYRVITFGRQALFVLETLYPFLITKKDRAKIGIEFQKKLMKIGHNSFADRKWQNEYCDKIRFLNHKGNSRNKLVPCWFVKKRPPTWNKGLTP